MHNSKFFAVTSRLAVLSSIALFSNIAVAGNLDVKVSKNSAAIDAQLRPENAEWRAGTGYLYHEGGRHLFNVTAQAIGETALGNLPTTVALGAKLNVFDEDKIDGGAVMLGGDIRINLPDVPGLSVEAAAFYAPSILSFNDAEGMLDFRTQVNYRVIPKADIFAGFQIINVDVDPGSHATLDEGIFAGLRVHF